MPVEIKASTIQTFYGGFSHQHQVLRVVIKLGSHRILTKFIHISGMELICKAWNRISGRLGSVLFFLSFWAAMIPADSFLLPSLARRQRTEPNASVPDGFGPLAQFWQHAGGRSRRLDALKTRDHSLPYSWLGNLKKPTWEGNVADSMQLQRNLVALHSLRLSRESGTASELTGTLWYAGRWKHWPSGRDLPRKHVECWGCEVEPEDWQSEGRWCGLETSPKSG